MKIFIFSTIILITFSCNKKTDSEKLQLYGDFLNQVESYEYNVVQQRYNSATGNTLKTTATSYFSKDSEDSILGLDFYIKSKIKDSNFISFYNDGLETILFLNDSLAINKHLTLYPPNKRMSNPVVNNSYHSIQKWISKNTKDSTFRNLRLKDTIIDNKRCDLFTYYIDFREHSYWFHIPENSEKSTTNSVRIAFSKDSKLPVYLYCKEVYSKQNYIVSKTWFNKFHQTHYSEQKLSDVPDYYKPYSGGNMLPKYSLAPNFILPNLNGDSIALSDLRSNYVLIEFSYIGCGPCIKSIPILNELQKMYADTNLKIYGINLYSSNPDKIYEYKINRGIEYSILWSDSDFFPENYYINSAPTIYLIDESGRIIYSSIGFKEDELRGELNDIFGT